eukprot:s832_g14.t1
MSCGQRRLAAGPVFNHKVIQSAKLWLLIRLTNIYSGITSGKALHPILMKNSRRRMCPHLRLDPDLV